MRYDRRLPRNSSCVHDIPMPDGNADDLDDDLVAEIRVLVARGPRSRTALVRLAERGDWRLRVLAVSGIGELVRQDATATRRLSLLGGLARVPGVRRRLPTVGPRGRLVSRSLLNAAADPSFVVRTAAALALGECRDAALAPSLSAMLADPFTPVRRAAAAALVASGAKPPDVSGHDAELTPERMAEGAPTLGRLRQLAAAHGDLLREAASALGWSASADPDDHARWLAGPLQSTGVGGAQAEAVRYDHEADLQYQLTKPFGHQDRADNIRQLEAFVTLAAHLDLPRGARVVDLGGGSGWVSALLARFGFTPIVVDVAQPLLRLARRRFAADRLEAGVLAADMTALPLGTGSVDAAIAIDALHHVEDLAQVLREVRRVLVPGGQFLIGEPGEGHSESAKSLAESREQGVRESEIHPLVIGKLAARAGFDRARLLPRVPSQATLDVSDLRHAMRQPAESWPVSNEGTVTRFDSLVLRTMLARPLLVLSAGQRIPDTRAPGRLSAEISPSLVRERDVVCGRIALHNMGDTTWLADTSDAAGVVWLGLQLLSPDGRMLNRELWRTRLPASVAPGQSCDVGVRAPLPDSSTPFRVKIDLVAERICWFEDRGSRPAHVDL
jgi:SAM-dependent methyltransferase